MNQTPLREDVIEKLTGGGELHSLPHFRIGMGDGG